MQQVRSPGAPVRSPQTVCDVGGGHRVALVLGAHGQLQRGVRTTPFAPARVLLTRVLCSIFWLLRRVAWRCPLGSHLCICSRVCMCVCVRACMSVFVLVRADSNVRMRVRACVRG
jgi:hypothetical protein